MLSSRGQAGGEALRQIGGENFFLRHAQVVRDAVESDDPRIGVEHGERGTPVAIAGLANGAGVDEIAAIPAQRPVRRFGLPHQNSSPREEISGDEIHEIPELQASC